MLHKIGRPFRSAVARKIAWTGADDSREIDDLAGYERRVVQSPYSQRNVYVFANDIDNSVGDQEVKGNLRVARQKIRQHRHEMMDRYDWESVHAQVSARRKVCRCNIRLNRFDCSDYLARMFEIEFPLCGQRQASRCPVYEAHAETILQPADELCHRGRRQA